MGERIGRYITHYLNTYFVPDKRNGMVIYSYKPQANAEERIYKTISDITISMKASDYFELPECVMNEVVVELSDKEMEIYQSFKKEMIVSLKDKEIDAVNAASLSNKLLQMANGSIYDDDKNSHLIHDKKLDVQEDLIESANGKPVLIAYWYQSDLKRIKERFQAEEIKTSEDIEK